jgi:hypothetical protein
MLCLRLLNWLMANLIPPAMTSSITKLAGTVILDSFGTQSASSPQSSLGSNC